MGCNCEGYRKGLSRDVGGIPVDCAQSNHSSFLPFLQANDGYTAKTVVLTGVHRGPHQAFYTGVKFLVSAQHPVVLF